MAQGKPRNLAASSSRFSYLGSSSNNPTIHIPSYETNSELFNLTNGMEMLGFPPSKNISTGFSEGTSQSLIMESGWQDTRLIVDDSSLRCVLPCERNESRPSQGLSLSLSSNKPSSIGIQSFELMPSNLRDGFFGKSPNLQDQDGFVNLHQTQTHFELKNSKYLVPAQDLLNEFCNLRIKQTDQLKQKPQKTNQWEDDNNGSRRQSFYSTSDVLELQKRKSKLISILEEVDRKYRQYCDRMKAVMSSFEAVAGAGAAAVYSASASKAMSRHFRCLRDGIVGQIKATKKAIGEKDPVAPGTTTGETPRLRLLDQTLRQQRAFQQISMMESHPWRPQRGLPERSVSVLRAWLFEHFLHPYPSDVDKHILARQTGLSRGQVSNWFINARVRLWKPMVEEIYLEETKEEHQDNVGSSSDGVLAGLHNNHISHQDQKPTADQLVRGNSDSLSSIISNPDKEEDSRKHHRQQQQQQQQHYHQQQLQQHRQQFGRSVAETFGVVDLDFSSYNHHQTANTVSYGNDGGVHHNFGNGVSLTLGLQQNSLFFPRDHLEDCQSVQYSILEGEGQNLPYRNLMGAQLLHDLAG
ncbi:homeobox protein BEL1 homolog [Macadamia integrifolia]|uniref:homeobox protein BEL1 homolog n=1 Tax=Macadamia integrifolia TaxID=60698 RepID=UPI001C52CE05|nr:homeobox protein BEL1 homolog [Macadamia integrifolia]XP_042474934.1 homeobox protein BEL1 homolog [Macadamia integrifolia]XP_042474935.1 homeobox protein BEL1 homolog [Macadamia integrifolia]XP_042474936.1 homeobox protein BEL1 homolog [Macadamia integrifolia]